MKILLSPAKSIDTTRTINTPYTSKCQFIDQATQLMHLQQKLSPKELSFLLKISPSLAEALHQRNSKWEYPDRPSQSTKPCITVFNGEVYRGLDAATWTQDDFLFANDSLRILSGMYGLLKPLDLMYPYRLEMGTKWQMTDTINNLYSFWNTQLAETLLDELNDNEMVVNLASAEYFKVVNTPTLRSRVVEIQFLEFTAGTYKTIAVYAKKARGKMARFAVQNKITDPSKLKLYAQDNYRFDPHLSSKTKWAFTR